MRTIPNKEKRRIKKAVKQVLLEDDKKIIRFGGNYEI